MKRATARFWEHAREKLVPAFAFDIDGVLKRGNEVLPQALEAMRLLYGGGSLRTPRVPAVFMTNGGGDTEEHRARALGSLLGVNVEASQVILSHTPMRELLPALGDSPVLVAGRASSLQVARAYGFKHAVSTQQLAAALGPASVPFSAISDGHREEPCPVNDLLIGSESRPFKAVLVLTDPDDWYRDLQLCADVVLSDGVLSRKFSSSRNSTVEVIFSQNDLLWANEYHAPRFGLGAFAVALDAVYSATALAPMRCKRFYGKPTSTPYRLAERLLQQQLDSHTQAAGPTLPGQYLLVAL